jgi:hypothetical protein
MRPHICEKMCSGMHISIRIVFVICNKQATDRSIDVINRLQHARYEQHFVVASVYERLNKARYLHLCSIICCDHR